VKPLSHTYGFSLVLNSQIAKIKTLFKQLLKNQTKQMQGSIIIIISLIIDYLEVETIKQMPHYN
jgi:hypothetical protein